jgi:two-component system cell cycle response regulator DivK
MKRILVIEDDETNLELVSRFLKREGYKVISATDGLKGVEMAKSELPNLILMDLDLPELDGWEATRRIKANPLTSHIPIIVLTAHALSAEVIKAREAGCDEYETKPLVYRRLVQKIRALLD